MKRIIALVLVLCMALGMVVSVSAVPASDFTRTLNLVRLIRMMFTKDDDAPAIGELNGNILTVYVDVDGKTGADGTKNNPFATIEDARDAIRDVNKSSLKGIDVVVGAGIYYITETIEFTEEDAGTEKCTIRYIGEEGAIINGGTAFDYTEFEKASGDTLLLFPEEVQDKLYMYDMGKLGYTADDIARMLSSKRYYNEIGIICVNGKQMDLARYPNADEGWIEIEGGYFLDSYGNPTKYTDNDNVDVALQAKQTVIEYGNDHMERVLSWSNLDNLFVCGRYKFIWCPDDTEVTERYTDRDEILLPYSGGYYPVEGGLLYFYNIPEELDVPGEYYVDDNAILYYYPEDNFTTASFTVPALNEDIISIQGAQWLILENLTLESTHQNGIIATADNITIKGCTVRDIYRDGITCYGVGITVIDCEVAYVGSNGISVYGGDVATLTKSNNLICNNYVHNWSQRATMNLGVISEGCGSTVCHNEVGDSTDLGMTARGPYHTVEYNYIYKTNKFFCDGGALGTLNKSFGTVLRYNVVIDTGYDTQLDIVGVAGIISDGSSGNEIYGNIVYNTTGNSLLAAGIDRDTIFHHNLCIKPGREGLVMNCPEYAQFYNNTWDGTPSIVEDYIYSEVWQTAFPTLQGIHGTWDPENPDDPMFFYAPIGNKAYNNYLFLDKGYETYPSMYDHKKGTVATIEDFIIKFSGENIETFSEQLGNLTYYNSKRNKNPITILEALAIANEACGTVMTEEQLNEVGRIGVEYNIGDILVQ